MNVSKDLQTPRGTRNSPSDRKALALDVGSSQRESCLADDSITLPAFEECWHPDLDPHYPDIDAIIAITQDSLSSDKDNKWKFWSLCMARGELDLILDGLLRSGDGIPTGIFAQETDGHEAFLGKVKAARELIIDLMRTHVATIKASSLPGTKAPTGSTLCEFVQGMDRAEPFYPSLMSCRELAQYLGTSDSWVHKHLKSGDIPVQRIGSRLLFSKREIDAWLLSSGNQQEDIAV